MDINLLQMCHYFFIWVCQYRFAVTVSSFKSVITRETWHLFLSVKCLPHYISWSQFMQRKLVSDDILSYFDINLKKPLTVDLLFSAEFAFFQLMFFQYLFLFPPCLLTGLCSGCLAGWLCDVCQEAAGHGPACESDGGRGPPSWLPQLVTARKGDRGRCRNLRSTNEADLRARTSNMLSSQTAKAGRDFPEY